MVTFIDFIDYCIGKHLISEEKNIYLKINGIIDAAIAYVKLFVSSARLNLYNVDDRYNAINHIYAAGAYTADWLNRGTELKTITEALASDDALMLIMINSEIDRDSVDSMTTCMEDMASDWINMASNKKEISLRLSNMLVGSFLLGVMTFMKPVTP